MTFRLLVGARTRLPFHLETRDLEGVRLPIFRFCRVLWRLATGLRGEAQAVPWNLALLESSSTRKPEAGSLRH